MTVVPPPAALPPTLVVAGGKGGVGKTTVAVNLAVALARHGLRTGLVDADVHGPDTLRMLGLTRRHEATSLHLWSNPQSKRPLMRPVEVHGLRVVSVQALLSEDQGFSAPGFANMLLDRLLHGTGWTDTEVLVVDLPPGTGEVTQHVLGATRPFAAVMVVTPQDVAHLDARKLVTLLRRWETPILGGVENMAPMACPCCGTEISLFPATPERRTIWAMGVERLVGLPFSLAVAAASQKGEPADPEGPEAAALSELVPRIKALLSG